MRIISKRTAALVWVLIGLLLAAGTAAHASLPKSCKIDGVPRIKQLNNYCGPACAAAVFRHFGLEMTQETAGRALYDPYTKSTSGADMVLFGIENGFSAYSWSSNIQDVKAKLAAGVPVIVLQQNSTTDTSGHYRVLTGYDDDSARFRVMDPYYDEVTELSYAACEELWRPTGYWALIYVPREQDTFKEELGVRNPVVHIDLALARLRRKQYQEALQEAHKALTIDPVNTRAAYILREIGGAVEARLLP
ncbi:MAG: C39 family peptidase [Armatimonadota bacterium]